MITLEQAQKMFYDMVKKSEKKYQIDEIFEIAFEEPVYVMLVTDENDDQLLIGEAFPSIRKSDGALVELKYPCPA